MSKTRTVEFRIEERRVAPLRTDIETLESPLLADEMVKQPILLRLLPVGVAVLVVVMIGLMIAMGRRMMSPMMFMMPLMLVMGMFGMSMHGSSGGNSMNEVDIDRKNWLIKLRELRTVVQDQGRRIHTLMVTNFPNPVILSSFSKYRSMWQVKRNRAYTELLPQSGLTDHPFMSARVGVGMVPLFPPIQYERQQVPENLEPVTAGQFGRFLRAQKVITNCPIAVRLDEERAYVFKGEDIQSRYDLSRAMLTSLAFNHSPNELVIGIIADPHDQESIDRWNWMKWLPHTQNTLTIQTDLPTVRLAWSSMEDFAQSMASDIAARNSQGDEYMGPNMLVFVDLPGKELKWPTSMFGGVQNVSFVAVNYGKQHFSKYEKDRANMLLVDAKGNLSLPGRPDIAKIDRVSIRQAENLAREIASYRPQGFGSVTSSAASGSDEISEEDIPEWFDVLNIADIESYDPRMVWKANAHTESFNVPLGYRNEGTAKTKDLVYLDMVEMSRGGTGPHGCVQGKTGTGKSYLLNGLVLTMCTLYGPDKVSFILADFKAGAAFDGYQDLPHVIQVLTNLEEQKELVDRAGDVIDGEIARREKFLFDAEAKDILEYRKMQKADPSLPPLPDMFFIADEFHEFMIGNRPYLKLFTRIGAKGRSLGMHVIPCSQFIDASLLSDLMNHLTFGISLASSSANYSRTVLDGDPSAATLPAGRGHAMLRSVDKVTQENKIDKFQGFSIENKYVSKIRTEEQKVEQRRALEDSTLPFDLFASAVELSGGRNEEKVEEHVETRVHDIGQKWALINHLNKFQDVKAPDLWQPSLTIPMSLGNVPLESHAEVAKLSGFPIRIGDIDDPFHHSRPPWIVQADDNIYVAGRSKSGKSMAIASLIANAALTYRDKTNWYIVDYVSGGLDMMETYPNVGGYATKMDEDIIARFLGEFYNVLDYREKVMSKNRISRVDDYLNAKRQQPDSNDPYEHMFLVLDGFNVMMLENEEWKHNINRLLTAGGRFGLHVVASGPDTMSLHFKQQGSFGYTIALGVDDTTRMGSMNAAVKQRMKLIPDQPGRGVDLKTGLSSLVMVPKLEIIEPAIPEKRGVQAKYAYDEDHSEGIKYLGTQLSERISHAPRISVVGNTVEYRQMWETFASVPGVADKSSPLKDRWLPIGIDTRVMTPVLLPKVSPHFVIAGDPGSGKTSVLRELITSAVNQYTSDEAKFIIFDPAFGLLNEMESLCETGYMKASNYVTNREESQEVVESIGKLLAKRQPNKDVSKNPRSIIERSWYDGPEVFVIIDNYTRIGSTPGNPAPIDTLVPLLSQTTDVGIHVFMATPASGVDMLFSSNKMFKMFDSQTAPILMLSGPTTTGRVSTLKAKFEARRPGRGELLIPSESRSQIVQVAWSPPWTND